MTDKDFFKPGDLLQANNPGTAKFYGIIVFLGYYEGVERGKEEVDCIVLDLQDNTIIKGRTKVIQKNFKHVIY